MIENFFNHGQLHAERDQAARRGPPKVMDGERRDARHEEPQRNLVRGRVVRSGDVLQHRAPGGASVSKLGACINPEIQAAAKLAGDAACTDMGAVRGTEAYTNYRLALLKRRDVQDAERRAGVSQALSELSNSIKPTYTFNNRINCTSTTIGNMMEFQLLLNCLIQFIRSRERAYREPLRRARWPQSIPCPPS
jgi:hypothetical protein